MSVSSRNSSTYGDDYDDYRDAYDDYRDAYDDYRDDYDDYRDANNSNDDFDMPDDTDSQSEIELYEDFLMDIDIYTDCDEYPSLSTSFHLKQIESKRKRKQKSLNGTDANHRFPSQWFPNHTFPYRYGSNIYFSPYSHSKCWGKNMIPIIQILESSNLIMSRAIWRNGWPQNMVLQINTNHSDITPSYLGKILSNNTIRNIPTRLDIIPAEIFARIITFIAMSPFDYPRFDGCMSCTF